MRATWLGAAKTGISHHRNIDEWKMIAPCRSSGILHLCRRNNLSQGVHPIFMFMSLEHVDVKVSKARRSAAGLGASMGHLGEMDSRPQAGVLCADHALREELLQPVDVVIAVDEI